MQYPAMEGSVVIPTLDVRRTGCMRDFQCDTFVQEPQNELMNVWHFSFVILHF
jgi:hypothetical protein